MKTKTIHNGAWKGFTPEGSDLNLGIKVFNSPPPTLPSILISSSFPTEFRRNIGDSYWSRQLPLTSIDWWKDYCDNIMSISIPSHPFQWEIVFTLPPSSVPSIVTQSGVSVNEVIFLFLPLTSFRMNK